MELSVIVESVGNLYPLIFSSSSDDDEDEVYFNKLVASRKRKRRSIAVPPARVKLFVEETIADSSDEDFRKDFRITRGTFELLHSRIGGMLDYRCASGIGRNKIDSRKQLLAVLWLLATPSSYRLV